jgi:glutaredoxin-related protein
MVVIVGMTGPFGEDICAWSKRCEMHCRLLEIEYKFLKFDIGMAKNPPEEVAKYWVSDKPLPIVWVDDELIGGFYDLIERFPVL